MLDCTLLQHRLSCFLRSGHMMRVSWVLSTTPYSTSSVNRILWDTTSDAFVRSHNVREGDSSCLSLFSQTHVLVVVGPSQMALSETSQNRLLASQRDFIIIISAIGLRGIIAIKQLLPTSDLSPTIRKNIISLPRYFKQDNLLIRQSGTASVTNSVYSPCWTFVATESRHPSPLVGSKKLK